MGGDHEREDDEEEPAEPAGDALSDEAAVATQVLVDRTRAHVLPEEYFLAPSRVAFHRTRKTSRPRTEMR